MASPNSDTQSFKYKGVRKRKWGKWVSEIRLPNSRDRIWLGSYDSADKAARAFDAALFCLRGSRANFNFPDTPFHFRLPPPPSQSPHHPHQSLTPHEIQALAARFANDAPPPQQQEVEEAPHKESESLTETASTGCTTSSSNSSMQLDQGDTTSSSSIDWSFLNLLEYSNEEEVIASDYYGLYSDHELHNFHSAGELDPLYPTSLLPFDHNAQDNLSDDAFSHQSLILWNFGYDSL